jgi:hypothetical protein
MFQEGDKKEEETLNQKEKKRCFPHCKTYL